MELTVDTPAAPAPKPDRVVTFTRCVGLTIGGQGRKVRGRIRIWIREAANFDESQAKLEMWIDEKHGPQLQLTPMPDGFVQTRDLISHGMEVVALIEAATETEYHYDDEALQLQKLEAAASAVVEVNASPFEQAVAKLDVGGVSAKSMLLTGGTPAIGQIK